MQRYRTGLRHAGNQSAIRRYMPTLAASRLRRAIPICSKLSRSGCNCISDKRLPDCQRRGRYVTHGYTNVREATPDGDWEAAMGTFYKRVPAVRVMDRAASNRVGTIRLAALLPEVLSVVAEIKMVLAPAQRPNSTSDSLSPTTTELHGSNFNSVAACSIKARFGFLQAQLASGA